MSWWQDKLHQLSSDSYLTRNKSHSTHSRDATRRIPPLIQRVHHFPPDLRVKEPRQWVLASSVLYVSQFSLSAMSNSLWPHGLQHTRLPWPSPTTGAYSNSCPSHRWCHPTISSSVTPFSSCLQSFPASESFLITRWPHNSSPRFLPKVVETRDLYRYLYTRVHCSIIHCWKVDGSFSFSSQPMPNPPLTVASLLKSFLYSNTGLLTILCCILFFKT